MSLSITSFKKIWIRENLAEGEISILFERFVDRLMKGREIPLTFGSVRGIIVILLAAIGCFSVSVGVSAYVISPGVGIILLIPFAGIGVVLLVISIFNFIAVKKEVI